MKLGKYIPDCITLLNLLCGSVACIFALGGGYYPAFIFIVAAACFDFLDGAAARALGAYSDLGKELDSLSDLVSFGLAPALMLFNWYCNEAGHSTLWCMWLPLLLPLAAAVRLARFNTDTSGSTDFKGLAVPGAAMISAPLVGFVHMFNLGDYSGMGEILFNLLGTIWFIPTLAVILSALMVSSAPMFSMKHKKLSFRKFPLSTLFICCMLLTAVLFQAYGISRSPGTGFFHFAFPLTLFSGFSFYVVLNIAAIPFTRRKAD